MEDIKSPPPENIIATNADGGKFIPINELENMLDELDWGTRNFHSYIFKDGYANLVIAASLELVVKFKFNGLERERSFVGACSFSLKSIDPNKHFLATAKSECVKNAASDIGKYFGRGLNDDLPPDSEKTETKVLLRMKPDSKIMKQFLKAVEDKDEPAITMLTNIYEINTE
jgi:hypothetical protein